MNRAHVATTAVRPNRYGNMRWWDFSIDKHRSQTESCLATIWMRARFAEKRKSSPNHKFEIATDRFVINEVVDGCRDLYDSWGSRRDVHHWLIIYNNNKGQYCSHNWWYSFGKRTASNSLLTELNGLWKQLQAALVFHPIRTPTVCIFYLIAISLHDSKCALFLFFRKKLSWTQHITLTFTFTFSVLLLISHTNKTLSFVALSLCTPPVKVIGRFFFFLLFCFIKQALRCYP